MIKDLNIKDNSSISQRDYSWDEGEVEALRKLVQQDKNLSSRTDDMFLLNFLRARKFDRESAFKLLKSYYSVRRAYPSLFENFTPSRFKEYFDHGIMGYLEHTDAKGRVIGFGKTSCWDPSQVPARALLQMATLVLDLWTCDQLAQVNGFTVIIDASGTTWQHAIQFTPKIVYLMVTTLQGCYPARYKEAHLFNVNKIVQSVMSLFLPLLPYKLRKRIHFHRNVDSLHKFIDPSFLPMEFGGELPPLDHRKTFDKLMQNEAFFIENERYWKA